MSSKSKGKTKGGFLVTRPLKAKHADALYAVLNQSAPQMLLPQEKNSKGEDSGVIQPAAVWKFNEFRKLLDEQRKPPPDGDFDGAEKVSAKDWRERHNLSEHFFSKETPIVLYIHDNVKGVLKHILQRMPNILPLGVHLEHWEKLIEAFRLTRWGKSYFADKALADPEGEAVDFDDEDDDQAATENTTDAAEETDDATEPAKSGSTADA